MAYKVFQKEEVPVWFTLPSGMLHDGHLESSSFPKNIVPPTNKKFFAGLTMAYDIKQTSSKNPLLTMGFTHVDPNTKPLGAAYSLKANSGLLLGDDGWANIANGFDTTQWYSNKPNGIEANCASRELILLDYEHMGAGATSTVAMQAKMAEFSATVNGLGSKLGCWGQGLIDPRPFYFINPDGSLTGMAPNETTAMQWRNMYNTPNLLINPLVANGNLQISNPFHYHTGFLDASTIYSTMFAHECAKIYKPSIISIPALWIQNESVDLYPVEDKDFIKPDGTIHTSYLKYQISASTAYSDMLWSGVWDGCYHFDTGRVGIADKRFIIDEFNENLKSINLDHTPTNVLYTQKYFGYYNYVYLALNQLSKSNIKPIIEANTPWKMPNYKVTNKANVLRTGDFVFTPFQHLYREPLIRFKYSNDGMHVLFIVHNPYNMSSEVVEISDPLNTWTTTVTLKGDWAQIGVIDL